MTVDIDSSVLMLLAAVAAVSFCCALLSAALLKQKRQQLDLQQEQTQALTAKHKELDTKQEELVALHGENQRQQQQIAHLQEQLERHVNDKQQLADSEKLLLTENADLKARQEQNEAHFKQQLQQLAEQRELLKKEFENLANNIFEAKGQAFTETNKQSLDTLLNPFKQQLDQFKTQVENIHHKDTRQRAELNNELLNLQKLNQKITEEAHQLATALKGQKKMQGNWGELVLENVLDRSGLQLGVDYRREVSFTTESGRSRPDAIVYLPEDKHLVIDAKTSLNAYTRYINAEDETERQIALDEHVKVVGERLKELADKQYFDLPGLNSPAMVFMFIPIESAFVEAFKADETLYQKALEQNILVATPTTLLTSLNIVRQLWRFEDQNKHTAELAEKAGKVYDKLSGFIGSMEAVGKQLDRARDSYDKAFRQLYTGPGNLVKQAVEFQKLGVSVKSQLDKQLVEKAELELEQNTSELALEES